MKFLADRPLSGAISSSQAIRVVPMTFFALVMYIIMSKVHQFNWFLFVSQFSLGSDA